MPRFLIEVVHENSKEACHQAVRAFLATGSHFVTNADWGCSDDVHKAWITVEVESKEQALSILPPAFRKDALVISLQKFALKEMDKTLEQHED